MRKTSKEPVESGNELKEAIDTLVLDALGGV